MKRKSTGPTTRDVVNHGAGKGDRTRVTDVKAYRANFDVIDWSDNVQFGRPRKTLQEIDMDAWRHGV